MTYIITTDSSSDMDRSLLETRGIKIVDFKYELNGQIYDDDSGKSLAYDDFYDLISAKDSKASTSAINTAEFIEFFKPFLEAGMDIVHTGLSSNLSSTYNNSLAAKKALEEEYPARTIYIIDSLMASSGLGLLALRMADLKDRGMKAGDLALWAEKNKANVHGIFTTTDLTHLVRGGRLSAPAGLIGGMLKICPLMRVDAQGKLSLDKVIRSEKKALASLLDSYQSMAIKDGDLALIHGKTLEPTEKLAKDLVEKNPKLKSRLEIGRVGTTIGVHTGPSAIGIFFWSDKERY